MHQLLDHTDMLSWRQHDRRTFQSSSLAMEVCTQGSEPSRERQRTSRGRVALTKDVLGGSLVGARHLSRMPAPIGAQLLRQGLVTLQVRLCGLRNSNKECSYSSKCLMELGLLIYRLESQPLTLL